MKVMRLITNKNLNMPKAELIGQCASMYLCVSAMHLRWAVEGVSVQDRLDHDEGLGQVLPVELVAVVGTLVRTVVEHLQKR